MLKHGIIICDNTFQAYFGQQAPHWKQVWVILEVEMLVEKIIAALRMKQIQSQFCNNPLLNREMLLPFFTESEVSGFLKGDYHYSISIQHISKGKTNMVRVLVNFSF